MRTISKAIKTSQCENKNWKKNLSAFLKNYRATPHSTTKKPPGSVMFKRSFRITLPEPVNPSGNYDIEKADSCQKLKMKAQYEKKERASHRKINVGDKVLVRNPQRGKLQPSFLTEPFTVVSKNNTMISAEGSGRKITRNSSFFKVLPHDCYKKPIIHDHNTTVHKPQIPSSKRPQREKLKPHYLKDFVS